MDMGSGRKERQRQAGGKGSESVHVRMCASVGVQRRVGVGCWGPLGPSQSLMVAGQCAAPPRPFKPLRASNKFSIVVGSSLFFHHCKQTFCLQSIMILQNRSRVCDPLLTKRCGAAHDCSGLPLSASLSHCSYSWV